MCSTAPNTGKAELSVLKRWNGDIYHIPSLKYLAESSDAPDDIKDAINTYFASLRVGDFITWDKQTDKSVYYTQDRHGNTLPEPVKSTRLYGDIDLEVLESIIFAPKVAEDKSSKKTKATK